LNPIRAVVLAVAAVAATGCASLFGTHQKDFSFVSEPVSAEVFLDGNRLGTTPLKVKLSNHKEYVFTFRKPGYKDVSCTLMKSTGAGWVVLDILGGLIPVIVDAATGNWTQTKGDSCNVTLPDSTAIAGRAN
jgi:hypothetical protein